MTNSTSRERIDQGTPAARVGDDEALEVVRKMLQNLKYGSVTIVVHGGAVVQVECTEKTRF